AAAAILVVVTLGWVGLNLQKTRDSGAQKDLSARSEPSAAVPANERERAGDGVAKVPAAAAAPQPISTVSGDSPCSLEARRPAARRARAGPRAPRGWPGRRAGSLAHRRRRRDPRGEAAPGRSARDAPRQRRVADGRVDGRRPGGAGLQAAREGRRRRPRRLFG